MVRSGSYRNYSGYIVLQALTGKYHRRLAEAHAHQSVPSINGYGNTLTCHTPAASWGNPVGHSHQAVASPLMTSSWNGRDMQQQQQQTFKVWQPQRAARSKRPNTPSDGSKHNGFQTTNQAVLIPKHVSRQDRAHDQEHHPLLHRLQGHGKQ